MKSKFHYFQFVSFFVMASAFCMDAGAHSPSCSHAHDLAEDAPVNWLTGENVSVGGVFFPFVHFQSVYGGTTADGFEHFCAGHHDPAGDGWTVQGFELGGAFCAREWFEAFASYHFFENATTRAWDGKFEEWFCKIVNLPGGLEVRGGRYLNRFGFHNSQHFHEWSYVDNNLVNGRFLGDDGLYSIGGEITWNLPIPWSSVLSVSVGEVPQDDGIHSHHGHGEGETEHFLYEPEDALFQRGVMTANWTNNWYADYFRQLRCGLSGAWGENRMGEFTQVYGAHFEYEWRKNGWQSGGNFFRWRTEAMVRDVGYRSEHEEENGLIDHDGSSQEFGFYTALAYGLENGVEFGLRGEFVSGLDSTEFAERYRVSPNVSYFFNEARTLYLRGQYNYDWSSTFQSEHSVWLQLGFNWEGEHAH